MVTSSPLLSSRSTVVASRAQVSADLGDEVAILGTSGGMYYGVRGVGARVWELVQHPVAVAEIVDAIAAEYEVDRATVRRDVLGFLRTLLREGLVSVAPAAPGE
jgi:hypothetical protein